MKVKILGAGWYGCSIAAGLSAKGIDVEVHECADRIFAGASGSNPARLHQGQHYPRSKLTRAFCQEHHDAFMSRYGALTHGVPVNLYAVARDDSYLDFGTYCQVLRNEIEYITVDTPAEYGLANVEGAILTGERHIVIRHARAFFERLLGPKVILHSNTTMDSDPEYDWVIDCTFCANDSANIDRYEACLTAIVKGPTDKAVTIMDGPFPSLYPWDEQRGLNSLTSAKFTPLKKCETWLEATNFLNQVDLETIGRQTLSMMDQMTHYWPAFDELYESVDYRLSIRAMPKSAADARLVDIVQVGNKALRVRAGKIDAVIHAEKMLCERMGV